MKRFVCFLLLLVALLSVFAFSSCDQDEVDSTTNSVMDYAAGALKPYFKEADEETKNQTDQSVDVSHPKE